MMQISIVSFAVMLCLAMAFGAVIGAAVCFAIVEQILKNVRDRIIALDAMCPECGTGMIKGEHGAYKCHNCGWYMGRDFVKT